MKTRKNYFVRWLESNNKIRVPINDPFQYKTLLLRMAFLPLDSTIEFIDFQERIFKTSVQEAKKILGHVAEQLEFIDISKLSIEEKEKITNAAPWDFWTNREMQKIIEKMMR